jgi:hypothetical protein
MTATMAQKHPASASEKLRLEPTALPTRLFRLGATTIGWHPVLPPAAMVRAHG